MRPFVIIRYLSIVLILNAVFMLVSVTVSSLNNFDDGILPLFLSCAITMLLGLFPLIFIPAYSDITLKESYAIVAFAWLISCMVGMLPFILYGGEFSIVKAWFESVSGYTTTGATILSKIEDLPTSIVFWRSSTQWLGGGGVVLFALVVLPSLGRARANLSKVEMSSLSKHNFSQGLHNSLRAILVVYILLTLVQTFLLYSSGLKFTDALMYSFATISTGGFAPTSANIVGLDNGVAEFIIFVFMLLAGLNYSLLYGSFVKRDGLIFKSGIVRYYFISMVAGALILSVGLHFSMGLGWLRAVRESFFQVASAASSTGFFNANTSLWPSFAVALLCFFMMQAACAGSTSGGIKVDRVVLFWNMIRTQVKRLQHPNAVIPVRIGKLVIADEVVSAALLFIVFYVAILFVSTIIMGLLGFDIISGFSASVACLGNVGPGFGAVGTASNYSSLSGVSLCWLTLLMLLGRLEIYGILMVVFIRSWR